MFSTISYISSIFLTILLAAWSLFYISSWSSINFFFSFGVVSPDLCHDFSWSLLFFFPGVSDCLLFKPPCLYHSFSYFQADMETSWVMPLAVSHHHFSKESILLKYYLPVLSYTSSYEAVCLLFSFLQWIFINIFRLFYNSYIFNGHLYSIE